MIHKQKRWTLENVKIYYESNRGAVTLRCSPFYSEISSKIIVKWVMEMSDIKFFRQSFPFVD